jgi:hypothetical protein
VVPQSQRAVETIAGKVSTAFREYGYVLQAVFCGGLCGLGTAEIFFQNAEGCAQPNHSKSEDKKGAALGQLVSVSKLEFSGSL